MAFFNFNQFPDVVSRFFFSFPVSYNKRKHTMLLNFDCWILEKRILSSGQIGVAFIRQCMAFDMPVSLNIDSLLRRCLNKHTCDPPPPPKKKKKEKEKTNWKVHYYCYNGAIPVLFDYPNLACWIIFDHIVVPVASKAMRWWALP